MTEPYRAQSEEKRFGVAAIQRAVAPILRRSGVVSAVRNSSWRRDRLAILCYHSFANADEHEWNPALFMRLEALAERFEQLREEGYRVVPLEEGVRRLYAGTLPERSVALTFDDGTRDFATKVVPLLERYSFPATVYLTTWYCEQQRPVFQLLLKYILWKGRNNYRGGPLGGIEGGVNLQTDAERIRFADGLRDRARQQGLSFEARDRLVAELAASLNVDYGKAVAETSFRLMTPEQVTQVARSPLVRVELHTHRHRTPLAHDQFQREICENRDRIVSMTGRTPRHFCYPSGVYDGTFLPWLRDLQVETATTVELGLASRSSNSLLLPRVIDTSNLTPARFSVWVSGIGHVLRNRARAGVPATLEPSSQPQV